jgi:hypothetical protein
LPTEDTTPPVQKMYFVTFYLHRRTDDDER